MKELVKTRKPSHANADEYWWCVDAFSEGKPYPVQITTVKNADGSYATWYDVAGSDRGYNIDDAEWYGKIETPQISQIPEPVT